MTEMKKIVFGIAVGDALGVPREFNPRYELKERPTTDMEGYGTYNLPPGTWSDDTSMTLCLIETLLDDEFSLEALANRFVKWYREAYWTPRGVVFDIGITTMQSINNVYHGYDVSECGATEESSNGNGSLMRILPLIHLIKELPIEERFEWTKKVSAITHAHLHSVFGCFIYLEIAGHILSGKDLNESIQLGIKDAEQFAEQKGFNAELNHKFDRVFKENFIGFAEDDIRSEGYVIYTLEAAIWCLQNTDNYKDATLKAVNLGSDTDTTAAVTGGLAALYYGFEQIPSKWVDVLARRDELIGLVERFDC